MGKRPDGEGERTLGKMRVFLSINEYLLVFKLYGNSV
jgi:hypothetical protein